MELQSLVAWSQIIAAVAVALTLVALVASIRQNTRAQKALAVDSLSAAIAAINVPAIDNPRVGVAVSKAMADWDSADREQRIMAHYFLFSFFKLLESAWYQQRAQILDRDQWQGWERMLRKYYHSRGVREVWWPNRRGAYSLEFQVFLAHTTPPDDVGSLGDVFDYSRKGD